MGFLVFLVFLLILFVALRVRTTLRARRGEPAPPFRHCRRRSAKGIHSLHIESVGDRYVVVERDRREEEIVFISPTFTKDEGRLLFFEYVWVG